MLESVSAYKLTQKIVERLVERRKMRQVAVPFCESFNGVWYSTPKTGLGVLDSICNSSLPKPDIVFSCSPVAGEGSTVPPYDCDGKGGTKDSPEYSCNDGLKLPMDYACPDMNVQYNHCYGTQTPSFDCDQVKHGCKTKDGKDVDYYDCHAYSGPNQAAQNP